jgi:maltose alpha-D-glucosyltransferase / alpha-amylase
VIEDLWYKNAVIYSLDVDTFLDSDGDGVGDFEGLSRRLDYLDFLGVDALWLAPFHPSPNRDNGYDPTDHYGVHPKYGSSGDFVEFMHQARMRGFRVLMDLVVNHVSNEHPWFQAARAHHDAELRDWFIWSKERPPNWNEGMVFPGVQKRTWTWDRKAQAYFFHRFYEFQPDLNMDNEAVRREVRRIMAYWLELGVSGFRVDALPFVLESIDPVEHTRSTRFEFLAEFRRFMQWRKGDAVMLGEANVPPDETDRYFGDGGDGVHMMFNFWVNQHLFYALAASDIGPLSDAIEATNRLPPMAQWANFLRNHDELDLGRLSKEQRELVFERFAPEPGMQLYGRGIRRRLAPMLGDRELEELAYSAMFALPGAPVIRFGDELRMGDDLSLAERNSVRTPMQWAAERHGGFTSGDEPVLPVIHEGVWSYEHVNVSEQRRDPDSFLNWMARMIRLRKECPEIGFGACTVIDAGAPNVLALRHDWRGNAIITLHNFDRRPHEACLHFDGGVDRLSDLLARTEVHAGPGGAFALPLDALDYRWLRVGGLDYAVHRADAD